MDFLTVLRLILSVGMPPSVDDEQAFRAWCRKLGEIAIQFAVMTSNTVDDRISGTIVTLVNNDTYWSALYRIIMAALEYVRPDDRDRVVGESLEINEIAQDAKLDPNTIVLIITTILQVLDWWRNRER
jgi:hypothetical protein